VENEIHGLAGVGATPSMTADIAIPFRGGCACGAIRYECTAMPVRMVNCHCRDCQRASGSGYSATVIMAAKSVRLLQGDCKEHRIVAESGHIAMRQFCGACGTPLFAASMAQPGLLGLKASSLDDPSWFSPEADVWVQSAQPWDPMSPSIQKYAKHRTRQPEG
jgi:hypothetical protein